MDYLLHYNILIGNAQKRNWNKSTAPVYTENHHIVPKSLGGSDDKSNLVLLTGKEHYVAHHLLYKIHTSEAKKKMAFAWFNMCAQMPGRDKIISPKQYERLKEITATYRRDYSVHEFYNIETKETVKMAAYDFKVKYKINPTPLYSEVNRCTKEWCVLLPGTDIELIKNRRSLKGEHNANFKDETFNFFHYDYGVLNLTRRDFIKKVDISPQAVSDLVKKRNAVVKGWQIWDYIGPPRSTDTYATRNKGAKNSAFDSTTYTFKHTDGTIFTGYRSDFIKKYKLNKGSVSAVILGKQKSTKGWLLK